MEHKIKEAFDGVHASRQLQQDTARRVMGRMKRKKPSPVLRTAWAAAACCALLLVVGLGLYRTPTSVISVDINPSLELEINRFGKVISVTGYNEDGTALAQELDMVVHMDYQQAMDTVLSSDAVTDCLARDELLSIAVVDLSDDAQSQEILDYVSACTAGDSNTRCYGLGREEVAQAHELRLSYGKYRAYLDLQEAGISVTAEEVSQMTMREIRQLLQEDAGQGSGQGSGSGSGQGTGQGSGSGNAQGSGGQGYGPGDDTGSGNGTGGYGPGSGQGSGN